MFLERADGRGSAGPDGAECAKLREFVGFHAGLNS